MHNVLAVSCMVKPVLFLMQFTILILRTFKAFVFFFSFFCIIMHLHVKTGMLHFFPNTVDDVQV